MHLVGGAPRWGCGARAQRRIKGRPRCDMEGHASRRACRRQRACRSCWQSSRPGRCDRRRPPRASRRAARWRGRHAVGDERDRCPRADAPRRRSRALQGGRVSSATTRTSLPCARALDDAKAGALPAGGERAAVAARCPSPSFAGAVLARRARRLVGQHMTLGGVDHRPRRALGTALLHAAFTSSRAQRSGGWPRATQPLIGDLEVETGAQPTPCRARPRRGGGRAAHRQGLDGARHVPTSVNVPALLLRQRALIDRVQTARRGRTATDPLANGWLASVTLAPSRAPHHSVGSQRRVVDAAPGSKLLAPSADTSELLVAVVEHDGGLGGEGDAVNRFGLQLEVSDAP